jgi:hypothetical protein
MVILLLLPPAAAQTSAVQPSASSETPSLYMPRNVVRAYQAGTRSHDGRPGKGYFQNKSTHKIRLFVAPPNRRVTGSQEITYVNNSPYPLAALFFRLELNAHAPEAQREVYFDTEELTSGIHIDEYVENGKVKTWQSLIPLKGMTWAVIKLDAAVPPGGTATFAFRWHFDLPVKSGREGAIDPTSFFIAYFYPRVAVFDDVNEWDSTDFRIGHEFYNEFNDYTLDVTVPKNFIVWATGDLLNADEVLQPKFVERLKRSYTGDETITIASLDELKSRSVTAQTDTVTWRWKADNISDVALAISDHFIWDASSVVVDKATGRRASVQAAYDEGSKDFKRMVEYGRRALEWSSTQYPGLPYPFSKTTIVRGFADMEYPMMANDSSEEDPIMTRLVAEHELLHTWFPFTMGINERRYSFMEEGWTTAFEYLVTRDDVGPEKADELFKNFRVKSWITSFQSDADIPIITPEDAMTGSGYGNNKYGRAALGYLALRDLLGERDFKKGLQEFIARWRGKHPIPWDMFYTFNDATGKDLNWFFNSWFFSYGYIDYAVGSVRNTRGGIEVAIKNIGGFPAPFDLVATYDDGSTETFHQTPSLWQRNLKEARVVVPSRKKVKSLMINGGIWMDARTADNRWEAK